MSTDDSRERLRRPGRAGVSGSACGPGVDAEMLEELGPHPDEQPHIYVFGPTPFVKTGA